MDRQQRFLEDFLKSQAGIRAFIASLVRDRHLADDVLQEVAVILWKKYDEFDPSRPFGAWARGVAARKIMQSFDRARRTPIPFSPEVIQALVDVEPAEADAEANEDAARLRKCLALLPDKSRELVRLRYEESLRLKDIATRMSSSLDAVHKALSRIRVALRRCVEDQAALEKEGSP